MSLLRPFVELSRRLERQQVDDGFGVPYPHAVPPGPVAPGEYGPASSPPAPVAPPPAPLPPPVVASQAPPVVASQHPQPVVPQPVAAPAAPQDSQPIAPQPVAPQAPPPAPQPVDPQPVAPQPVAAPQPPEAPPASDPPVAPAQDARPAPPQDEADAGTDLAHEDTAPADLEGFQAVDASVVPVPMETFHQLVSAVDRLGTELATVQLAIRELTEILTESRRSSVEAEPRPFGLGAFAPETGPPPAQRRAPEPEPRYAPQPVPATPQPVPVASQPAPAAAQPVPATPQPVPPSPPVDVAAAEPQRPDPPAPTAPEPDDAAAPRWYVPDADTQRAAPAVPEPAPAPTASAPDADASVPLPPAGAPAPAADAAGRRPRDPEVVLPSGPNLPPVARNHDASAPVEIPPAPQPTSGVHPGSLDDVPLVSIGEVQVLLGPIHTLDELDALEERIRALHGVDGLTVSAFESTEVLVTLQLSRPIPLASLLRTELGREVASCRLFDGRIVVDFGEEAG